MGKLVFIIVLLGVKRGGGLKPDNEDEMQLRQPTEAESTLHFLQ